MLQSNIQLHWSTSIRWKMPIQQGNIFGWTMWKTTENIFPRKWIGIWPIHGKRNHGSCLQEIGIEIHWFWNIQKPGELGVEKNWRGMIFCSNCVIEALKRKLDDWKNIRLIPIIHGFHFHMLWYEIDTKTIKHFTYIDRKNAVWVPKVFCISDLSSEYALGSARTGGQRRPPLRRLAAETFLSYGGENVRFLLRNAKKCVIFLSCG